MNDPGKNSFGRAFHRPRVHVVSAFEKALRSFFSIFGTCVLGSAWQLREEISG